MENIQQRAMSFLKKLRKPESTVGLFFWTILWVPFQALLLNPVSLAAMFKLVNAQTLPAFPHLFSFVYPQVFIGYVFVPIIYCVIVSMIFKPKRLVSPLNIQIGAFVIVGSWYLFVTGSTPFTLISILVELETLGIVAIIALPIGYIQRLIVRVVIGLDYDEENIQQITYICNTDFETLTQKVLSNTFLNMLQFSVIREDAEEGIYKRTEKTSFTTSTNIILAILPDNSENKRQCLLSFVSYRKTFDDLTMRKDNEKLIHQFYEVIDGALLKLNPEYGLTEDKSGTTHLVTMAAKTYATYQTKSMFEIARKPVAGVWKISHYYIYAIILTLAIIWALTLAYVGRLGSINPDTYLNSIILGIFVLVAEIGIPLREELNRRGEKRVGKKTKK